MCGRVVETSVANNARPFCSPRCKLADLDRWLSGSYRVPGPPVESSGMEDAGVFGNGYDIEASFEHQGDDEL